MKMGPNEINLSNGKRMNMNMNMNRINLKTYTKTRKRFLQKEWNEDGSFEE